MRPAGDRVAENGGSRHLLRAALRFLAALPAILWFFWAALSSPIGWRPWAWTGAHAVFVAAFLARERWLRSRPRAAWLALAVMAASALAMVPVVGSGLEGALLAVVAAELAGQAALRPTLLVTFVLSCAGTLLLAQRRGPAIALDIGAAWFTVALVAALLSLAVAREVGARRALAGALDRLAARSRAAERSRIARDLHDLLGHRLIGVGLHLEVASHLAGDSAAREPIDRARAVARLLLDDVRSVVRAFDDPGERPTLAEALRQVAGELPAPRVIVEVPEGLEAGDALRHDTLVGAARELIANAARHGGATSMTLVAVDGGDGIELTATDDGGGTAAGPIVPTGGLVYLRERLELVGGTLDVDRRPGHGVVARLWVPLRREVDPAP